MALSLQNDRWIKQSPGLNRISFMHLYNKQLFGFILIGCMVFLVSCDDCPESINEVVGDEYFTFDYGGASVNASDLLLYVDISGGEDGSGSLELIEPTIEGGKVGPISFTERFLDPVSTEVNGVGLENTRLAYDYYIRRNSSSEEDVLRVEFFLEAGPCETKWSYIRYFLNAQLLEDLTDRQQVNILLP